MTITIEDAPAVKHITIDIDFTGSEPSTTVTNVPNASMVYMDALKAQTHSDDTKYQERADEALDLGTDFSQDTEVVDKPEIEIEEREVLVSDDMTNAEF